jgi:hypothetical protein
MHTSLVQDKIVLYNMTSKYIKIWSEKGFYVFIWSHNLNTLFLPLVSLSN